MWSHNVTDTIRGRGGSMVAIRFFLNVDYDALLIHTGLLKIKINYFQNILLGEGGVT